MTIATMTCPRCASPMVLRKTDKFLYGNGEPRLFYGCSNWPACSSTCGAHPDGTPSSVPADDATKAARRRAHEAFDRLWNDAGVTRQQGYAWLRKTMDLPEDEAHIGRFDVGQCELLIEAVEAARDCWGLDAS